MAKREEEAFPDRMREQLQKHQRGQNAPHARILMLAAAEAGQQAEVVDDLQGTGGDERNPVA